MYKDPAAITKMVDDKDKELKDLKDRFEYDYNKLWRLPEYQLGKKEDYDIYTSNLPRNLANKIIEILGYAPLQISIPQENDDEKEREAKAAGERLIYGALNIADERLRGTVQPTIQEQLAFYAVLRGWVVLRCYLHVEKEGGETIPDIVAWDPLNVVWDVGSSGKIWVCHKRPITAGQAKSEYGASMWEKFKSLFQGKSSKPVLYDFWDEEGYQVIHKGENVLGPETHGLGYIPVFVGMVGPAPFIQSGEATDTIKDFGESVYGPERGIFPVINKIMTYRLTLLGQGVHPPLGIYSRDGQKPFQESPYRKGDNVHFSTDNKEDAKPLFTPTIPSDAASFQNDVQRETMMGGALPLLWGVDEPGGSGYRANLLTHAASTTLLPRQRLMENALEWGGREILAQYKGGGFGKLRVRGHDGKGKSFDTELSPGNIEADWFPEAKLSPQLPQDEAGLYAMMEAAVRSRIHSRETAMDKVGIQDIEAEKGRISREDADDIPSIRVRKIMKELTDDGRPDLARQVFQEYLKALGLQPGGGTTQTQGMPSNVLPPAETQATHLSPEQIKDMSEDLKLKTLGLERGK